MLPQSEHMLQKMADTYLKYLAVKQKHCNDVDRHHRCFQGCSQKSACNSLMPIFLSINYTYDLKKEERIFVDITISFRIPTRTIQSQN